MSENTLPEQNGRTLPDAIVELYDKNPVLAGSALLILVITPIVAAWVSLLKKKEEEATKRHVHIHNKRKSRKKRKG